MIVHLKVADNFPLCNQDKTKLGIITGRSLVLHLTALFVNVRLLIFFLHVMKWRSILCTSAEHDIIVYFILWSTEAICCLDDWLNFINDNLNY